MKISGKVGSQSASLAEVTKAIQRFFGGPLPAPRTAEGLQGAVVGLVDGLAERTVRDRRAD